MKNLEEYLELCNKAYAEGTPLLPDDVYDRLVENSKLQNEVGYQSQDEVRFAHAFPMFSLQKVFMGEDKAPTWFSTSANVTTTKLDGAAISITYMDGELVLGLTRGDGKQGLDITDKVKQLAPPSINIQGLIQITGEVVAPKSIPNARNYASGAMNLKDLEEFNKRDLTFIAYGIHPYPTENWTTDMKLLSENNFKTVLVSDYTEFPNDGKVVRLINNKEFETLGYTSHHPRGAFALKKRQAGVVTKLLDVEWNVGKSGAVSPVAILEPCVIGEATVSRATLHNIGFIESLELEIGCMVEVIRSGEIIPRIVRKIC